MKCIGCTTRKADSVEGPQYCQKCYGDIKKEYAKRANTKWKRPDGRRDIVFKDKQRIAKVERGEIKDDYTNHFYSHFGFYDEAQDLDNSDNATNLDNIVVFKD